MASAWGRVNEEGVPAMLGRLEIGKVMWLRARATEDRMEGFISA